jgi:hypothetical protein
MPDKLPYLSDEHHYAIAAVTTRSSQMEHMVEMTISVAMMSQNNLAEYLLKNLGQDRIVGALAATLSDQLTPEEYDTASLISRIKAARTNRNDIIHSIYGVADDPTLAKIGTIRPYRQERFSEHSAADFYAVAQEMLSISMELARANDAIFQKQQSRRKFEQQLLQASSALLATSGHGMPPLPQPRLPSSDDRSETE